MSKLNRNLTQFFISNLQGFLNNNKNAKMPFFAQKRQQNQNETHRTPKKTPNEVPPQMDPKLTPNESPTYP